VRRSDTGHDGFRVAAAPGPQAGLQSGVRVGIARKSPGRPRQVIWRRLRGIARGQVGAGAQPAILGVQLGEFVGLLARPSEEGFDFLRFYQDGFNILLASIFGEVGWEQKTFSIPAGSHALKWLYIKDPTVSDGQDAAWVDEISWVPTLPAIEVQPSGLTTPAGADVGLEVSATGALPLAYQWLKGGLELAGATQSRLLLPKVGRCDSGVYAVRVSNPDGTVLSSNAALCVRVAQRLGAPAILPDGGLSFRSGDADGGSLWAEDLVGFEAQASANLTSWLTLSNALSWTNGLLLLRDPDRANHPRRFYRVLEH
jgi:hypothetical protein